MKATTQYFLSILVTLVAQMPLQTNAIEVFGTSAKKSFEQAQMGPESGEIGRAKCVRDAGESNDFAAFMKCATPADIREAFEMPPLMQDAKQASPDKEYKLVININLVNQTFEANDLEKGGRFGGPVKTGKAGFNTEDQAHASPGHECFEGDSAEAMHYSRKYKMAPMPYSIFFSGGVAIHSTGTGKNMSIGGNSHGCVHMGPGDAGKIYKLAKEYGPSNVKVCLIGESPASLKSSKATTKKAKKPSKNSNQWKPGPKHSVEPAGNSI